MNFFRESQGADRCWVAAILVALLASSATAADGRWVTEKGRKLRITRSTSEFAVELRDCSAMNECAKRLETEGVGTLESVQLAPDARLKMMKTPLATSLRRSRIKQDPAVADVRSVYRFEGEERPVFGTGTVVVKTRPGLSDAELTRLWSDHGLGIVRPVQGQADVYMVTVDVKHDELLLAEVLADDRRTVWSQPNFRRELKMHQVTPSDQYFSRQWHLNNTGQFGGTAGADIDAPEAWAIATGQNVLFGIFDDCVDVDHEDLKDNYSGIGQDVTLSSADVGYSDPRPKQFGDRHGTSCIGLAVARANARGGRGVAYEAKFAPSRGLGEIPSDSQIASAFVFARDNNVDVHTNSWGIPGRFPDPAIIVDAIRSAYAAGRNKGDLDGDGTDDALGMLIFFSSGNDSEENIEGFDLSALPQVLAIGASTDSDKRSFYSSFGSTLSVLAPSDGQVDFDFNNSTIEFVDAPIFTTDNTDSANAFDTGYNRGGVNVNFFVFETDPNGNYTDFFGGTSAACPIAAGVAGLILSVNPNLTANDVRMLIEHTADRIDITAANHDRITSHSLTYGYGRINAGGAGEGKLGAVEAAQQTLTNGGITWPDRAADVGVDDVSIRWTQNPGTTEYLVVQSDNPFEFVPVDGECYDGSQGGCVSGAVRSLPAGVTALAVGCGFTCDGSIGQCVTGTRQCVLLPAGNKSFAIYARNSLGRYSWGVGLDSAGNVNGSGRFIDLSAGGDVVIPTGPPPSRPTLTINVSPLEGTSPLTVHFQGNATSSVPIDEARTIWDFDINQPPEVDETTRAATHIYEVAESETRTFIARLTMYDTNGTPGVEEVAIKVTGASFRDEDELTSGNLRIIVGLPNTPDSNVSSGTSPFDVLLSVDASGLPGTLQSVNWDLGDGERATSLVVPHTYLNEGDTDLRIPVSVAVTTATSQTTTITTSATRIITVKPGLPVSDGGPGECTLPGTCAEGPGGAARPCGLGVGLIPMLSSIVLISFVRLRRLP